jgi:hypothetical protein
VKSRYPGHRVGVSARLINHAVRWYLRCQRSLRDIEALLFGPGAAQDRLCVKAGNDRITRAVSRYSNEQGHGIKQRKVFFLCRPCMLADHLQETLDKAMRRAAERAVPARDNAQLSRIELLFQR